MAIETELKLRIAPEHLARLKRHALLKNHQLARPVTQRVYSIYYDTPKLKLQQSGMALRLRRVGRRWVQTLKGGGGVHGGLHQRNEWETPVDGPSLQLDKLQHIDYIEYFSNIRLQKIRPLFVTDFARNSRMLMWQGAEIELCIDHGEISTEHQKIPLCELELELKSGELKALFDLALAILDIVPCELQAISKAEQGYRLYAGKTSEPVKAIPVKLRKQATLADALQTLMGTCMLQFQANIAGATGADSVEYIHQMRIALRRLRVLLRMAANVREDAALPSFRQQTSAIARQLGSIREWDVLLLQTLQPMSIRMAEHAGVQQLQHRAMAEREAAWRNFIAPQNQRSLQKLMLQFGRWLYGDYWQHIELLSLETRNYAEIQLAQLKEEFEKARNEIDKRDMQQLHALRIKAKRLRYAVEFFKAAVEKSEAKKLLAGLVELQDTLGLIHDNAIAMRLLDRLAVAQANVALQEAVALAKGWLAHELEEKIGEISAVQFQKV